jgi:hypothetical protein
MNREDIEKLLGGYATGSLTPEEREALFAAALEDQALFDELMREEALREALRDPAGRAELLGVLDRSATPWYRRLGWWPAAAAGVAFAGLTIAVLVTRPKAVTVAELRMPPAAAELKAPAPGEPAPAPEAAAPSPGTAPREVARREPAAQAAPPPPSAPVTLADAEPAKKEARDQRAAAADKDSVRQMGEAIATQQALGGQQVAGSTPQGAPERQAPAPRLAQQAARQQAAEALSAQQATRQKAAAGEGTQQTALGQQAAVSDSAQQSAAPPSAQRAPGQQAATRESTQPSVAAESADRLATGDLRAARGNVAPAAAPTARAMSTLAKARSAAPALRLSIRKGDQETPGPAEIRAGEAVHVVVHVNRTGYLYVLERVPGGRWQARENAQVAAGSTYPVLRTYPEPGRHELSFVLSPIPIPEIATLDPPPAGTALMTLTVR